MGWKELDCVHATRENVIALPVPSEGMITNVRGPCRRLLKFPPDPGHQQAVRGFVVGFDRDLRGFPKKFPI